jgi:DNA polymerase-1
LSERKRLYLIDGYSTLFRAFYAIRGLSNSKGEPTNAVYGFVNMLRKLLREEHPDLVGVALDTGGHTFRREKFEEYKANRSPMPDDLRAQLPSVRRAIEAFHIPILELEKYEADDVLGTMAKRAAAEGFEVVLVTADKDLFQLVGDGIRLFHTGREKLYDAAAVQEDFGVAPERVPDVLALMGDTVDNVPGVPGIGEKGAKKLITEYGSLESLLDAADEVKRKSYREGLQEHREQALLSKDLATVATDLDLTFDPEALHLEEPDYEALYELYRENDFFSLLKELEEQGVAGGVEIEPARACGSSEEWQQAIGRSGERVVLGLVGDDEPLGVALRDGDGALFADFRIQGLRDPVCDSLRSLAARDDVELVGHDLKELLRLCGPEIEVAARLTDTMLLAYLLRSSVRSYGLADVVLERLHHKVVEPKEAGWDKGEPPIAEDPRLLEMAAERAILPDELAEIFLPLLESGEEDPGEPSRVYREIEEPLLPVLLRMEEAGIEIDREFLREMSQRLAQELDALEAEIYELAGEQFNIQSPAQLGEIMFEKLGYPVLKRTRKTRKYSTDADTLEELAARGFDLPERLLRYRELSKLKSTYVDALPELADEGGRVHTRFNQAVAATGRLSSTNPNLQNIPVRTGIGQEIRKAFRAGEGRRLLVADYSQIELRVLAHIAQEQALIEAFQEGADIHRSTAASVFGVEPALVNDDQRRAAKVINFGIIYGMSPYGLAKTLGIATGEAKQFIEAYFERFPGVRRYTEETLEAASEELCVTTLYGRTRWLPDIRSRNYNLRENAKRMAINARIQGTAADLLKLAMIAVDRLLRDTFPDARLLLTVHDELVLEVPAEDADRIVDAVRDEMEQIAELDVPLVVDAAHGETWYEAKP